MRINRCLDLRGQCMTWSDADACFIFLQAKGNFISHKWLQIDQARGTEQCRQVPSLTKWQYITDAFHVCHVSWYGSTRQFLIQGRMTAALHVIISGRQQLLFVYSHLKWKGNDLVLGFHTSCTECPIHQFVKGRFDVGVWHDCHRDGFNSLKISSDNEGKQDYKKMS
jgi:hypothetical protein